MRASFVLASLLVLVALQGCGSGNPADRGNELIAVEPDESVPPDLPREQIENPLYTSWSSFKKGTTVVHRSVTETAGNANVTTTVTTYKLVNVTEDEVEVEMQASTRRYDGFESNNPPQTLRNPHYYTLPPGVKKEEFGKPRSPKEEGEETIEVAGKNYKARWETTKDRNEAGEVLVKMWLSDDVPGRLLKSVTTTPAIGKTTTLEVVEVRIAELR